MIIVNPYSFYSPPPRSDELFHHGIKGQKWGHMNGPPYPLGASDHSASEKKAGWRSSLNKGSSDNSGQKPEKSGLTDKQKRALKIGAAAIGVALVAGGTAYAIKSGKLNNASNAFGHFGKIGKVESSSERLKACNPFFGKSEHFSNNCGNCIIANELRSRGEDVEALGNRNGLTLTSLGEAFTFNSKSFVSLDEKIIPPPLKEKPKDITKIREWKLSRAHRAAYVQNQVTENLLKQYPDGSRGAIAMHYAGKNGRPRGHFFSWSISNGKVVYENPQDPKADLRSLFARYIQPRNAGPNGSFAVRLDNASINHDNINKFVGRSSHGKPRKQPGIYDRRAMTARGHNFIMSTFRV